MAPSFLTRMRNGSHTFNKDQQSSSTLSLPLPTQQNAFATQKPMATGGMASDCGSDWHGDPQMERNEVANNQNSPQQIDKNQGISLRKRFFSKSGTPMAMRPTTTTATAESKGMKEKLNPMTPNGQAEMTNILQAIEQRFSDQFEKARMEPVVQLGRSFEKQREQYQWQDVSQPPFPPHCRSVPREMNISLLEIFDMSRLISALCSMATEIPRGLSSFMYGDMMSPTMAGLEQRMRTLIKNRKSVGAMPSIASRPDWYSDACFAQQSFTGPNPTSITRASAEWIARFMVVANKQGNKAMYTLLNSTPAESIYIQDYSYFRRACGASPSSVLQSNDGKRFGCAAVTLFQLSKDGLLHPLAIILDYRGNMENSVVMFNRRLSPIDSSGDEAKDWPWRYAKMCHQVSDWTQQAIAVHLNDCHYIMEATIVACQRAFPSDHVIYNLLAPHWSKTLSCNAASRSYLVPDYITAINGFSTSQTYSFIMDAYKRFNWTARYIPNDLKRRGFAPNNMQSKMMHNYVWAKNMCLMWPVLYKFVWNMLSTVYESNEDVLGDNAVQNWCSEMQSETGGQMSSFPDIRTMEELTCAVMMCIHIASPQHNSVNYPQSYYMSFVPNKPACLMAPLPNTLSQLIQYGEKEMMAALPMKDPRVWMMCSQLPYLLSEPVAEDQTMAAYARTLQMEARTKKGPRWQQVEKTACEFGIDLMGLHEDFRNNSEQMDDTVMPYDVMDPMRLAVSVLI